MTQNKDQINNRDASPYSSIVSVQEQQRVLNAIFTQALYGDSKPYVRPPLHKRALNFFTEAKHRISNAWDALCGRLDYDY